MESFAPVFSALYTGSSGQTIQDLAVQHHQLCKRIQALQGLYHLHSPLWRWNMDPARWLWKKDPGFGNQVPEEISLHLLLGAQDQLLGVHAEQAQLPCGSTGTSSYNCQERTAWFGHVTCHDSLSKTILHGILESRWRRGRQRKCWTDNIKEWTSLPMPERLARAPEEKTDWGSVLNRPSRPPDDPIGQEIKLNWTLILSEKSVLVDVLHYGLFDLQWKPHTLTLVMHWQRF